MSERRFKLEDIRGVGNVRAKRLRELGIHTPEDLIKYSSHELVDLGAYEDESAASRALRNARLLLGIELEAVTGLDYEIHGKLLPRLTTGVPSIDRLLTYGVDIERGGLEPGAIYEFAGEFGAGKTWLCHQLAVTVQLPEERGGVGGRCLYVDTEDTFKPQWVRSIAERFGLDPAEALKNIFLFRRKTVVNVDTLEDIIRTKVPVYIDKGVRLVVVDSIIALYRREFKFIEKLARRQARLNYLLSWLQRHAEDRAYIVVTNQVVTAPQGVATRQVPAGGNIIAHGCQYRYFLRKRGELRRIEVLDAPGPEGHGVLFKITDRGVEEVEG